MPIKKPHTPPKDFEEALKELEAILAEIEKGEVGLEECLSRYERGTFLIQQWQRREQAVFEFSPRITFPASSIPHASSQARHEPVRTNPAPATALLWLRFPKLNRRCHKH